MKDSGAGRKRRKEDIIKAERTQAVFFGYKPMGFLGFLLPKTLIGKYCESRFYEQSEIERERFCRWLATNKRRRERAIKKAIGK